MSFFINDFQIKIWEDNYRYKNETIEETQKRLVNSIFKNEDKKLKDKLYNALINKRIFFGGRVTSNIGTEFKNTMPFNCYSLQNVKKPYDSLDSIYEHLKYVAKILKTEGGVGINFSVLRPKGTIIKGVGVSTPGVVSFMENFDNVADVITRGGNTKYIFQKEESDIIKNKIRKGALLSLLYIWHPDIIEYIEAKKYSGRLTKFNMSVAITNEFMEKLKNDEEWVLEFPDIHFKKYDDEWDGDLELWKNKGYPTKIYDRIKAKELWNLILKNSYNRNEPGLYFIDNANNYNNTLYYQKITGPNPCGEISLCGNGGIFIDKKGKEYRHLGDICNLGSLNLVSYFDETKKDKFNWKLFINDIKLLVRGLDNILDIANYPFEEIKNSALLRRKIGCGLTGYGSLLFMLGYKYNSKEANEFTEKLMYIYSNIAYRTSARLAKEKGSFILYDEDKIFKNGFIKNGKLNEKTKYYIKKFGLRNSQLLTIAPTGNLSIYAGLVSSGVEPVFEKEYYRWVIYNHRKNEVDLELPNYEIGEFIETKDFKFKKKGDEIILESVCGNYLIHKIEGLKKKIFCEDYGWRWCKENLSKDEFEKRLKNGVFNTSMELSVEDHINPFIIFSKYIDNSISKTINMRNNYPFEEFSKNMIRIWEEGCRGITSYREGTMVAVLEIIKEDKEKQKEIKKEQKEFFEIWKKHNEDIVIENVKIPDEYPAKGFIIKSEGKKFYFHIAFKDRTMKRPFAIFCTTNSKEKNVNASNAIEIFKNLAKISNIPEKFINETLKKIENENNINKITRMVALLLRHNVNIGKIVKEMDKIEEIFPGTFLFVLKKLLMRYVDEINNGIECPYCGEKIILKEGCFICSGCEYSKC